jgi:hypothetical protein
MKFTQPMQRLRNARTMGVEQILGLMLQMDKIGMRW